jgi:hypothetical protein
MGLKFGGDRESRTWYRFYMKHEPTPTLPNQGIKFDDLMRNVVRVKPEKPRLTKAKPKKSG